LAHLNSITSSSLMCAPKAKPKLGFESKTTRGFVPETFGSTLKLMLVRYPMSGVKSKRGGLVSVCASRTDEQVRRERPIRNSCNLPEELSRILHPPCRTVTYH